MDYCTQEYNKSIEDIEKFIQFLIQYPILLYNCIDTILNYYKRKYIVYTLLKDNQILIIY